MNTWKEVWGEDAEEYVQFALRSNVSISQLIFFNSGSSHRAGSTFHQIIIRYSRLCLS